MPLVSKVSSLCRNLRTHSFRICVFTRIFVTNLEIFFQLAILGQNRLSSNVHSLWKTWQSFVKNKWFICRPNKNIIPDHSQENHTILPKILFCKSMNSRKKSIVGNDNVLGTVLQIQQLLMQFKRECGIYRKSVRRILYRVAK